MYILIFLWLLIYSVLKNVYIPEPFPSTAQQPSHYEIDNVTVTEVICGFPYSSQYLFTPHYIFYLLFVFAIVFRGHEWLTAGAAASVMTYSGVAAIHMIVLFIPNDRYDISKTKSLCESIALPGSGAPFLACNGVVEPDLDAAFQTLNTALIGALPLAAWSKTFRASNRKPIFLLWIILLSVGHVFYNIAYADVNRHFQICPRFHVVSLPQNNYQSALLNPTWHLSLHALVSGQRPQNSIGNVNETLDNSCLYSCFASQAYTGRTPHEIGVYEPLPPMYGTSRWDSITAWWALLALGLLTFFTSEKPKLLPQVVHKPLFALRPWPVARTWWSRCFGSSEDYMLRQEVLQISAIKLVGFLTQFLSVAAFVGNIIYTKAIEYQQQTARLQSESFSAVGQWGGVAVVVQVLIAVIVGYSWRIIKGQGEKDLELSTHCTTSLMSGSGETFRKDEETGDEEWDCRVGYAS